jgi:predicted AlkP superfamily phosphohydrolase/phosphomutase
MTDPRLLNPLVRLAAALVLLMNAGLAAGSSGAPSPGVAPAAQAAQVNGRVIVLGFDGADARTAAELMDRGLLPHLAALRAEGTFSPLETTNPAESPVSWAALNSGQNPAKTGVPGFIRRDLRESRVKESNRTPSPTFGHLAGPIETPVEQLQGAPIPSWNANVLGAAVGLGALLLFLGVFLLLRMRPALALGLSLLLGGASFVGGRALRSYLPSRIPVWNNPVEAAPFWETAAAAGVKSLVLDAAQAFDRDPVEGAQVLAGLGVPDARGSVNSFFIYTSDEAQLYRAPRGTDTSSGGLIFRIDERNGRFDSSLPGPVNFWEVDRVSSELREIETALDDTDLRYQRSQELNAQRAKVQERLEKASGERVTVPVVIQRRGERADVTIGEHTESLSPGAWSGWYSLTFPLNPILKVRAIVRAKLIQYSAERVELYVDALQYDPAHPPFWQPLSQPARFSRELAHACGPFETVGWACMNLPLKDAVIDSVSFMQDIEFTLTWREQLTREALSRKDWRILMSCESTPDRVQHMMYRYYDPEHPLYSAESAAQRMTFCGEEIALSDAIPASYRRMDAFVGEVQRQLKPEDTLIVCSDHGFQSFKHQVHLNNWLIEKGYLVLKASVAGLPPGADATGDLNAYVDWSKTRAYALGLGMVYVNLKGREGRGIVAAEEKRALLDSIARDFLAHTDEATGAKIGAGAYVMEDIHSGPHADREADMLLCFSAGYRVSWLTTGGGMSGTVRPDGTLEASKTIVPNDKAWSGDHVTLDPSLVRGIFFSNRKLAAPMEKIDLLQIAPTVLKLTGVAIPPGYDMPPLEFAR